MDEDKKLKKIITWAGIIALIAVPVIMVIKKKKKGYSEGEWDDESDIYAPEQGE